MTDVALAIDLGTGGCKAALVDLSAQVVGTAFVAYPTEYPAPGRHEQRPADWWDAVVRSSRELLAADAGRHRVIAVGLSGQSLAMVPVDADGTALIESVPIWSDTRGEDVAAAHFTDADEPNWYEQTGNGFPRGMYTVFKAGWLRANRPDIAATTRHILGSKDWVNARLTGVSRTDPSYASGSGAYDLRARRILPELLGSLHLPLDWWPAVVASTEVIGRVTAAASAATGLPAGVPVVAGGVDNSCMALGAGLDHAGAAYVSLGSSNWVTTAGSEPVLDPVDRPFVFDHVLPDLYVSALSTFGGGSSLTWLATLLGRDDDLDTLLGEAAGTPVGANGLTCVPTLAGGTVAEGGPAVRGAFLGLDLGHTPGDLTRALVEGIGFSLADAAHRMLTAVPAGSELIVTGGGARGGLLLQILADLVGRPISRPGAAQHGAALGAAALALLGTGAWADTAPLRAARQSVLRVAPRPELAPSYALPRARFDAARSATRAYAEATPGTTGNPRITATPHTTADDQRTKT